MVYGHVSRGLHSAGIGIFGNLYSILDTVIYSFHMPLFFFLSGLFFYNSLKKYGGLNLIGSKVDTLIYPYLLWSIIQISIEIILSNYTNGKVSHLQIFQLLWRPIDQFWFLYALFFVYLISIILFSIRTKYLYLSFFILSLFLNLYQPVLPNIVIFNSIPHNLIFFSLGIGYSLYELGHNISKSWIVLLSAFVFIISQYISIIYALNSSSTQLVLAITGIFIVISFSAWISKFNYKIFALLGSASLSIYLMHILVTAGVRIFLVHAVGIYSLSLHLFIGCFAGILLPTIAFKIIDRYRIPYIFSAPVIQWSSVAKKLIKV